MIDDRPMWKTPTYTKFLDTHLWLPNVINNGGTRKRRTYPQVEGRPIKK